MSLAFTPTQVPHGGQRVRGFSTTCGYCGVVGSVPANNFKTGGGTDDEQVERFARNKFERLGWKIGKAEKENRCPGCFAAIRNAAEQKRKRAMTESSQVIPLRVKADEPKVMGRDDRRIIFEKLNEVYADEKIGYSPGWTDKKVGEDLGIPRGWVQQVRDEMFGPEGANEDIRKALEEARGVLAEAKKIGAAVHAAMALLSVLATRAEKIERTLIEIEGALR